MLLLVEHGGVTDRFLREIEQDRQPGTELVVVVVHQAGQVLRVAVKRDGHVMACGTIRLTYWEFRKSTKASISSMAVFS